MNTRLKLALSLAASSLAFGETAPDSLAPSVPASLASPIAWTGGWWDALGRDSLPGDSLQKIAMNLGVLPGTDANGNDPRRVQNALSASLVAGEAGAIRGVQLSGAMNEVHGSVRGVQATYGLNIVGGSAVGVQAGGVNLLKHDMSGFQYGYLFNKVGGNVSGWQLGAVGNVVAGEVRGVQSASLVNKAGSVVGVQDGFLNLADKVRGAQGGFVNVADNIKGVQWGFVNIADTMVGPQIGLINIRPDARYFVESWFDETGMTHVSLNYGSPGWYNLIDIAGRGRGSNRASIGLGFGGRVPSKRLILSLDGSASLVIAPDRLKEASDDSTKVELTAHDDEDGFHLEGDPDELDAMNGLFKARLTVGYHLWGRLAVFGGVSGNLLVAPHGGYGTKLLRPMGDHHWDAYPHHRMWTGFFAGIRI